METKVVVCIRNQFGEVRLQRISTLAELAAIIANPRVGDTMITCIHTETWKIGPVVLWCVDRVLVRVRLQKETPVIFPRSPMEEHLLRFAIERHQRLAYAA